MVTTTDGTTVATHVYGCSPDLWLRPEALDMAGLRLERWSEGALMPWSGVVQRDGAAHRRPRPLAITGVVVADGQPVPAAPVVGRRLHLLSYSANLASAASFSMRPDGVRGRSSTGRPPWAPSSPPSCWVRRPKASSRQSTHAPISGMAITLRPSSTGTGSPDAMRTHERAAVKTR